MYKIKKNKLLHVTCKSTIKRIMIIILLIVFCLFALGTAADAAGLFDETVQVDSVYEYERYNLENYQLDFYDGGTWTDWLPWNWGTTIAENIMYGIYVISNGLWYLSLLLSNATGSLVAEAFSLDFIGDTASSLGKNIQTLAGVSTSGFDTDGFYPRLLLLLVLVIGIYITYVGLIKRETSKAITAFVNFVIVFVISASLLAYAPGIITNVNDFSSDMSTTALELGTKIVLPDSDVKGKDSVGLIRDSLFGIQIKSPWLILEFGTTDVEEIGVERIESILSESFNSDKRTEYINEKEEDNDNLNVGGVMSRLATVLFLFFFNLIISVFVMLMVAYMLFTQILFMVYAMMLPVSLLLGMIPTFSNKVRESVLKLFNILFMRTAITLILTITFSVSAMLYSMLSSKSFFLVAFMQILLYVGVFFELRSLMDMLSLDGREGGSAMRFMARSAMGLRKVARKTKKAVGSVGHTVLGGGKNKVRSSALNGGSVNNRQADNRFTKSNADKNNSELNNKDNLKKSKEPLSKRVGATAGKVFDTKNNIADKAGSAVSSVKNAPVNASYAINEKKNQIKRVPQNIRGAVHDTQKQREGERLTKRTSRENDIAQKRITLSHQKENKKNVQSKSRNSANADRDYVPRQQNSKSNSRADEVANIVSQEAKSKNRSVRGKTNDRVQPDIYNRD